MKFLSVFKDLFSNARNHWNQNRPSTRTINFPAHLLFISDNYIIDNLSEDAGLNITAKNRTKLIQSVVTRFNSNSYTKNGNLLL